MALTVSVVSINCKPLHRYILHNQLKFIQLRVQEEEEEERKQSSVLAKNKSPSEERLACIPCKNESLILHICTPTTISAEQNRCVFSTQHIKCPNVSPANL
jgi:hypothetical protein